LEFDVEGTDVLIRQLESAGKARQGRCTVIWTGASINAPHSFLYSLCNWELTTQRSDQYQRLASLATTSFSHFVL
jgi:hypothetical protein